MAIIDRIESNTARSAFLQHAKTFAGAHHERWDGTGYPAGLRGREIPLEGRLMAIADTYDELLAPAGGKASLSPEEAVEAIARGRGSLFDPHLVDVFLLVSDQFIQIARAGARLTPCRPTGK
jgi:putative two-component system response regulator